MKPSPSRPNSQPSEPYPEERRQATVLFADLVGFTPLAERLDFETVTYLIKEIWQRLDAIILQHNGYIDKHLGDGIMAVWGAPFAGEDDVERALSTALEMNQSFQAWTQQTEQESARVLQLRIGVNTGMVLATYIGLPSDSRPAEYTVIGDTVNVASRLEEMAEPGTILTTESTYRAGRGLFRMRRLNPVPIRGKTETITPYVVEDRLEQPSRVRYRDSGGLETIMVGRDEEWTQLMSLYRGSQASFTPTFGVVVGEIGLGKSRLLMEFTSRIEAEERKITLLSVRGLAQADKSPYFLWKSLWKDRFGLTDDLEPEQAREKFLRGVLALWGHRLGSVSAVEAAHMIGDLIGLSWPNSPFVTKYADAPIFRARRAFEMTRELLSRIADTGPTVLLLDDLQWVDKGSLDLIAYLMEPSPQALPLLILAGARPELFRKEVRWANMAKVIQVKPIPFNPKLVRAAYPALRNAPEPLLKQLAERADGNPYFLEEMVKSLVQSLTVESEVPSGQVPWPERMDPPASLRTLLQSRLDALPREARDVALLASVIGRVFWEGAILAEARQPIGTGLLNLPPEVLERVLQNALRQLVRAELAFPRTGSIFAGEKEYIFKHSLLREVAYSMLPIKYRQYYHLAVAGWLAQRAGPDFQVVVAEHFEEAGDRNRAVKHYQQGAEFAKARGAEEEVNWISNRVKSLRGG